MYRSRWESRGGHNAGSDSHSTPQTEIKHEEVTSTKRIRGSTHFVHSASIQGYMDLVYIRTVMVCQDINYTRFHILLPQLKYVESTLWTPEKYPAWIQNLNTPNLDVQLIQTQGLGSFSMCNCKQWLATQPKLRAFKLKLIYKTKINKRKLR